ncbi:ABC transporter ATP-binding protein/permease [Streptomonospora sp. S1-112]|uniref:ABC transporter ATP-binding protein/permease n=1 Tax=Streptomonospora mangrovi TaxID=2883123 RepID=A0A9X3SCJ9_9ACTN|nr:ABC transporter ATP-binding protein/permease [Streptomonospora mangrovi]MDA0562827.1 ABC transporter ATP-binding protein/permease [Streptomonospora mangrovi]
MKPLDPRLVRTARAVRVYLAVTVVSGVAVTGFVLAQAWLLSHVISGAAEGAGAAELSWAITAVAAVAVGRAAVAYAAEAAALRSAAKAKSELRRRLVAHVTGTDAGGADVTDLDGDEPQGSMGSTDARRPRGSSGAEAVWLSGQAGSEEGTSTPRAGELVTLATRGLDALDDYFARYLPQLVLAVLVPVAVLVVVAGADWISAVVIAVTLPLIPIFMALVGWHTQARTQRQWQLLNRLGGHFLDVVEGLPTLAIFRRAKAQAAIIRRITDEHRRTTMSTLRVAFLSAFVLELLSTLAVALVAVEIGIRLMYGMLDFQTALLVLILAPEAYLPLREVGARFHASMEGVAAAEQVFTELERRRASGVGDGDSEALHPAPAQRARSRSLQESTELERRRASGAGAAESEADPQHPQSGARSRSLQESTALERRRASGAGDGDSEAPHPAPVESLSLHQDSESERHKALDERSTAPWIRLDQVTLTYPGRDIPALDRASLVIEPGKSVLLMGPSGSGKSTLLSLLLRFLEPTSGRVLIREPGASGTPDTPDTEDGWIPLDDVPPDRWRRRIAWVPQSPYLFADTVADNIRLGDPDADMDAVRRAAELAEADTFIRALPQGYETPLGERGARLSAGQRQRIAVARAFLRDAPIVLLDEPTAHLDPDNAAAVRVAVRRLLAERTGVVVAHDAHWADAVDEVVAVRSGRVEPGVHS